MPKTALGVQLTPHEGIAVYLKGGWQSAAVDRVVRFGRAAQDAEPPPGEVSLPKADTTVSALPADSVFQRSVELPFSDRSKVEQVAPLEAEESLPLPLEDLVCHVHILRKLAGRTQALLVAAPTERVEHLLEGLREHGLEPKVVDVEALALAAVASRSLPETASAAVVDLSPSVVQVLVVHEGQPWAFHALSSPPDDPAAVRELERYLARTAQEGFSLEVVYLSGSLASSQDLTEWSRALERPVDLLPFPGSGLSAPAQSEVEWPGWAVPLGLALREGYAKRASQVNLLRGPFALSGDYGPWKRLAVWTGVYAGVLGCLWGATTWVSSAYQEARYESLRTSIRNVFEQTLPSVTRIENEANQMRVAVRELEGRAASLGSLVDRDVSPLNIFREISARIPKDLEVEFRDFAVEEGRVRVEGVTTSFDAIDRIKTDLEQYPRFASVSVSDAKAGVERDKVIFKLTIGLGQRS